jgi:hypothetical protein
MHEFGWGASDHDLLAAGSLVGHIIECGCQATGGLFTDWEAVPDWANIGYPIAECRGDGTFRITKPAGTGGLIARGAVAEQLLYEIGDPGAYLPARRRLRLSARSRSSRTASTTFASPARAVRRRPTRTRSRRPRWRAFAAPARWSSSASTR